MVPLNNVYSLLALAVLLFATMTSAIPYDTISPYPKPYWQATAGRFYHRCSGAYQVEYSKDQRNWKPSAICLRGTCCSNLADSPMCSQKACGLVDKELRLSEERKAKTKAMGSPVKPGKSSGTGKGSKGSKPGV